MTGAPEHLYNLFATYDLEATRTSGRDRPTYVFEATTDGKVKITADVGGGTGAAVTIGSGINPDSGDFEYEVVVEGQQDTGPATDVRVA